MVTTQMKTDAQRFGNGKKGFNVKQVEEMLENAGGNYTAGTGIDISESDEISVDTTEIQTKLIAGDGIDITENVVSMLGFKVPDTNTDFAKYNTDGYVNTDLLVMSNNNMYEIIPKGTKVSDYTIRLTSISGFYIQRFNVTLAKFLTNGASTHYYDYDRPSIYTTNITQANGEITFSSTTEYKDYLYRYAGKPGSGSYIYIGLFIRE